MFTNDDPSAAITEARIKAVQDAIAKAPLHKLVSIEDIGALCAYLASDVARTLTGGTIYVDGGFNIVGS